MIYLQVLRDTSILAVGLILIALICRWLGWGHPAVLLDWFLDRQWRPKRLVVLRVAVYLAVLYAAGLAIRWSSGAN